MIKTLDKLRIGERGIVKYVNGEGRLRRRMFDMGITPGTSIWLKKKAPFGDPIEIALRGYELSLRNNEAATVEMEVE